MESSDEESDSNSDSASETESTEEKEDSIIKDGEGNLIVADKKFDLTAVLALLSQIYLKGNGNDSDLNNLIGVAFKGDILLQGLDLFGTMLYENLGIKLYEMSLINGTGKEVYLTDEEYAKMAQDYRDKLGI